MKPATPKKKKTTSTLLPASWTVALSLVAKYGPLSIIGIALIYWVVIKQDAKIDLLINDVRVLQQSVAKLVDRMQQDNDQLWVLIAVNQRTCLNTAKSDSDRMNCVITTTREQR